MKNTVLFLIVIFIFMGCSENTREEKQSPAGIILSGEHELRKMSDFVDVNSKMHGNFFLFFGSITGKAESQISVKFAWKMNDGMFAISSLPIEKIRIRLDNSITSPTIRFKWQSSTTEQVQQLMDYYVDYAIVTVKESEWPINIKLPLSD